MRNLMLVCCLTLTIAGGWAQQCELTTAQTVNGDSLDVDLFIRSLGTPFVPGTCAFVLHYDAAVIAAPRLVPANNGPWSDTDPDYAPLSSIDHADAGYVDMVVQFDGGGDLNGTPVGSVPARIGTLRFHVVNAAAAVVPVWRSIGSVTQVVKMLHPGVDLAYQEITDSCAFHVVALKAILQGAWAGAAMSTSLRTAGYIPLTQPYSGAPWSYGGTEAVAAIPPGIVDWVLVELRTGTAAGTRAAQRAAFIRSDGAIVDLDGESPVGFPGLAPGAYHAVIRHRNHLAVMTATPVAMSAVSASYDLTTGVDRIYGGDAKQLVAGVYAMYAGDVTGNGAIVLAQELTVLRADNLRQRYDRADVTMNGAVVLALELTVVRANNLRTTKVP